MRAESLLVLNHLKIRLMNLPVDIRLIWTLCLEPCDNWNTSVAKRYLFKEESCCTQMFAARPCFVLHARNQTGKGTVFHSDVPAALPPHLQLIYKERHV